MLRNNIFKRLSIAPIIFTDKSVDTNPRDIFHYLNNRKF